LHLRLVVKYSASWKSRLGITRGFPTSCTKSSCPCCRCSLPKLFTIYKIKTDVISNIKYFH
jgi:hypothetical protein